jgi:hypothetical protein
MQGDDVLSGKAENYGIDSALDSAAEFPCGNPDGAG